MFETLSVHHEEVSTSTFAVTIRNLYKRSRRRQDVSDSDRKAACTDFLMMDT
jgi:hypothetical protein